MQEPIRIANDELASEKSTRVCRSLARPTHTPYTCPHKQSAQPRIDTTMPVSAEHRTKIVKDFAIKSGDTGSPEVQVALLTESINDLSEHLKAHRKDFHSRRGLVLMAAKRNRLLRYLSKAHHDRYTALISRLGLRK